MREVWRVGHTFVRPTHSWYLPVPGNRLEVPMRARGLLVAVVVTLISTGLTAGTALGQIGCCVCQDCPGPEVCLTQGEGGDEEGCSNFCNFYGCPGKALLATVSGCQVSPVCDQVFAINSTPVLSHQVMALTGLFAFGFGAIAVRRRERRSAGFARPA